MQALRLPTLADALCAHLNCRGVDGWLAELARALGLPPSQLMPQPPVPYNEVQVEAFGLALVLRHPHAGWVEQGDPERWLIQEVKFGMQGQYGLPWQDPLPFGLNPALDTVASARARLEAAGLTMASAHREAAAGHLRQTWLADAALALELSWDEGKPGIAHAWVLRLGSELLAPMHPWLSLGCEGTPKTVASG